MIKQIARFFSYVSAFSGFLLLVKSPPGILGGLLWLPKLWAGAWAPFLALMGGFGALMGWGYRDRRSLRAGVFGTAVGLRHMLKVISSHNQFNEVFGADWQDRIPTGLRGRLTFKRYRLIQPKFPPVPGQRNVVIGRSDQTNEPLLCDIWEPPESIPHTGLAVIYFHGGLWQAVDKDFLTQPFFRRLVRQGHVIMDVAYSLAPGADLGCMLGDVKRAIVWMKAHAVRYGGNPDRIVLMGASGGAHLALLGAYAPDHPAFQKVCPDADISVRAVVSTCGLTDLRAFYREYGRYNPKQPEYSAQITDDLRPRVRDKTRLDRFLTRSRALPAYRHSNMPGGPLLLVYLLGGTLKEVPEAYRLGSPMTHVGPHCPPTMQLCGDDDFIVNVSHPRRLHQALRNAGVPSLYIEFPDTVHAFDQYFGVSRRVAPAAQAASWNIERFLALMV